MQKLLGIYQYTKSFKRSVGCLVWTIATIVYTKSIWTFTFESMSGHY